MRPHSGWLSVLRLASIAIIGIILVISPQAGENAVFDRLSPKGGRGHRAAGFDPVRQRD